MWAIMCVHLCVRCVCACVCMCVHIRVHMGSRVCACVRCACAHVCMCVHVCASVCVITLEIYSSSKFQVYNILLLTIVAMIPGQEDPLKK